MNEKIAAYDVKMTKTINNLDGELATIRAGRANPHVLDKIAVDYYGSPTPIQQVANVSVPEARMIQIQPWEKSMLKAIEKAILTSDIGINPTNDGTSIRLVFPELTEDRRKELAKDVKKKGEEAKVAVRNIRRDGNVAFKKRKGTEISEDEIKDLEDELQKITDKYIAQVDKMVEAKSKGMPRHYGHAQGSKNVERICEEAWRLGIKYLTVYAFSTENWSRPKNEVDALMTLLRNYMKTCLKTAAKNDMKIRVIGDIEPLDENIKSRIKELEEATVNNGGLNFTIALNYGSRDEITRAVKKIAEDCREGKINPDSITEKTVNDYLDTHDIPDPDLMIRTSGEQRLSNYLLWQLAYSEFYFTDVPWPAFTKEELIKAIEEYNHRHRRFGGVEEEK